MHAFILVPGLSPSLSLSLSTLCLPFQDFYGLVPPQLSCCCSELAAIFQAFRVPQLHLCCINLLFYPPPPKYMVLAMLVENLLPTSCFPKAKK